MASTGICHICLKPHYQLSDSAEEIETKERSNCVESRMEDSGLVQANEQLEMAQKTLHQETWPLTEDVDDAERLAESRHQYLDLESEFKRWQRCLQRWSKRTARWSKEAKEVVAEASARSQRNMETNGTVDV
eukprot:symbB.v1.2.039693.t1/scaffold6731.1/size15915/2